MCSDELLLLACSDIMWNLPSGMLQKPSAGKGCNSRDLLQDAVIPIIVFMLGINAAAPHCDARSMSILKTSRVPSSLSQSQEIS